jgi:hypothetical protein
MSTTKAYHGGCHCGDVKYLVKLTFPPIMDPKAESIRLYKCNCSTCHKMGMFHCRPISPANDFILTSPSNIEELGDYRAFSGKIGWYFCKKCGVRLFGLGGQFEPIDLDVKKWAGEEGDGTTQKVWRTAPDAGRMITAFDGKQVPLHYLSVNATTIEPAEGLDLREWHDKGWIFYVNTRDADPKSTSSRNTVQPKPHHSGTY